MNIFAFALISIFIYFTIAAVLIRFGVPKPGADSDGETINFNDLIEDYSALPELQPYTARDGATLYYRHYPAETDTVLILLHGSGWHSRYFVNLAASISGEHLAQVYTPDLRGHGTAPQRRGDIDYLAQFEDDIADLMDMIAQRTPGATFVIGGHSSGGGLAVRFGGGAHGKRPAGYIALAPFLKHNAPTTRQNAGGWATPFTGRIIGLTMLNNVGVRQFNHLTAITFNMPEEARDGTETLAYSFRLNTGYAPRDYKKDLAAITQPLLVAVGGEDEAFYAEQYEPTVTEYTDAQVEILPGVNHMGIVTKPDVQPVIKAWLRSLA